MTQGITDVNAFLKAAISTVTERNALAQKEEELRAEVSKKEKTLNSEEKAVNDSIQTTVRKRRDAIVTSYDTEISKLQDKLKKVKSRREKAKNQGIKERIKEETTELHEHNRELRMQMKTLFQKDRVPRFCNTNFYYSLYFPQKFKEFITLFLTFAICFGAIPCGIYFAIPTRRTAYLAAIYAVTILVFGSLYVFVGNRTKDHHLDALKEGKNIRALIASNDKKIAVITSSVRKDRSEASYNLEKFDDEIAQISQELEEVAAKKNEALSTFENVTKTIITDEITENNRQKLDDLRNSLNECRERLQYTESAVKEKTIEITNNYGTYLDKEFLVPEKLEELRKIMETGTAVNLSEAIEAYKNRGKQ